MNVLFVSMVLASHPEIVEVPEFPPMEVSQPHDGADESVKKCEEDVKGLRNGMLGLEFYLKDKKYHERVCPNLDWKQPSLETYKEHPKSYLPEECPRDVI